MSNILAQSTFFIGSLHNDACMNASDVSSFNRLLWSLFTQLCLDYPRSHIVVLYEAEVVVSAESKLHSRKFYKSYWNLEVYARMPRLESNYVYICKLHPLCFVACSFWRRLHYEGWKLCKANFVKCLKEKKTFLTAKMAFDRCWRFPYSALVLIIWWVFFGSFFPCSPTSIY